jgi:hypothetical protein
MNSHEVIHKWHEVIHKSPRGEGTVMHEDHTQQG